MPSAVLKLPLIDVVVSLHTAQDPDRDEWAVFISQLNALKTKHGGNVDRIRNFVVSDGGAPSATQRSETVELFASKPNPVAVVTNALSNPLKRGIATAIAWVNPGFRGYHPKETRAAMIHAGCESHEERLWETLLQLQQELPPIRSLAQAAEALGRARPSVFGERPARPG